MAVGCWHLACLTVSCLTTAMKAQSSLSHVCGMLLMSLLLLATVDGVLAQGSFDTVNFNNRLTNEGFEAQVNDTTIDATAPSGGDDSAQLCVASTDHAVLEVRAWTSGAGTTGESADV